MNAVLEFAREELNRYCKIIFGENEGFDIEFAVNKDSDNPFRDGFPDNRVQPCDKQHDSSQGKAALRA